MCLLAASCLLVSRPLSPQISPVVLRMSAPVAQMSPELDALTKLSNEELKERVTAMAGASPAFAAWLEAQEWPVPAAAVAAPVAPKANGMVTPWADIVPGADAKRLSDASAAKTVLTLCKGGTLCTRLAVAEAADAEPLRRGFLSHVSYVMDDEGFPCFPLADSLAAVNVRDTKKADGLAPASFFVHGTASTTLLGDVESFDVSTLSEYQLKLAAERSGMSEEVLTRTPWHRVVPQRVYYADPIRSSESWVAAGDYATSTANPLAAANAELIRRLSTKQLDLDRVAAALMGVPVDEVQSCSVLGVDQLGFDLLAETSKGSEVPPAPGAAPPSPTCNPMRPDSRQPHLTFAHPSPQPWVRRAGRLP